MKRGYKRLQEATGGYKGLQGIKRGYRGLKEVNGCSKGCNSLYPPVSSGNPL